MYKALELLKKEGVAKLSDFPYDQNNCDRVPDANDRIKASNYKIADWRVVNVPNLYHS